MLTIGKIVISHRMQSEPLPSPDIIKGVLSFDFDGTLINPAATPKLDPGFFHLIETLNQSGWIWGVNTGRSQMQMVAGFNEGAFPFLPDFMVARERELYTPGRFGRWIPDKKWNARSEKDHKKMFRKAKKIVAEVKKYVETETNAQWVSQQGDPAGVIATSEEELQRIVDVVEEVRGACPTLSYLRNTIYMRFSHINYHKGTSIQEVANRLGVSKENIFCVGDGHNDLDKLHPEIAGMIACPSNSDREVLEHVKEHGGFVASSPSSHGVIEALEYYFSDILSPTAKSS